MELCGHFDHAPDSFTTAGKGIQWQIPDQTSVLTSGILSIPSMSGKVLSQCFEKCVPNRAMSGGVP